MDDERIISLFFARDEAAIEGCRAKYGAYLRRVAENVTGSALDAEECEADAYEAAWRRIPPERPRSLRAWLAKAARFAALNMLERDSAQKRGGGEAAAVLAELEDEVLAGMPVMGGGSFEDELTRYFDHMRENAALFRTLIVRRGSEDFTRRIVDASLARYRPGGAEAALTERYAYVFYIHGVIGILTGWLTDGFPLPSRELARLILRLCRI